MDDLQARYARLVAALGAAGTEPFDIGRLALDAEVLAAEADSTWMRVQARALAAAIRTEGEADADLETIVDASLPPADPTALSRLDELLPGGGSLVDRLAAHERATSIPPDVLRPVADAVLQLLRLRAVEDLDLPVGHDLALVVVERPANAWRAKLEQTALMLNACVAWTADRLVRTISVQAYPGRHLVQHMRPHAPEWCPSPEATVDRGLAAVGREILLADHELAHELERIGRAAGVRWGGERIVAVRRALDDLAPLFAGFAKFGMPEGGRGLSALGVDDRRAQALVTGWLDPLARAESLARAAGPPLVRAWLVETGQTIGLQRLLSERLVPTILRADMVDGTD